MVKSIISIKESVQASVAKAWQCVYDQIRTCTYKGLQCSYFPLFFQETGGSSIGGSESLQLSEIDSCATSIGMSILSMKPSKLVTEEIQSIRRCLNLLLKIQDDHGGWPSIVPLTEAIKIERMEGTINDTFYALTALFDIGLPTFDKEIADIPFLDQMKAVRKGLSWLLTNKLNQGWYYVEKEFIRPEDINAISSAILPTTSVVVLLARAKGIVKKANEEMKKHSGTNYEAEIVENEQLLSQIETTYKSAVEWLKAIKNSDGWGNFLGSKTTVTNTLLAMKALLTDDSEESLRCCLQVLRSLLKKNIRAETLSDEDIFETYYQIWVCRENKKLTQYRRPIVHEKHAASLLLQVLVEIARKKIKNDQKKETSLVDDLSFLERSAFRKLLKGCSDRLLFSQKKTSRLSGAYRGFRHAPLSYPIYATHNSIMGLRGLPEIQEIGFRVPQTKYVIGGLLIFSIPVLLVVVFRDYIPLELWKSILLAIITQIAVGAGIYGVRTMFRPFRKRK